MNFIYFFVTMMTEVNKNLDLTNRNRLKIKMYETNLTLKTLFLGITYSAYAGCMKSLQWYAMYSGTLYSSWASKTAIRIVVSKGFVTSPTGSKFICWRTDGWYNILKAKQVSFLIYKINKRVFENVFINFCV